MPERSTTAPRRHAALTSGRLQLSPRLSIEPSVSINWVDLPFGTFRATLLQSRAIFTVSPRLFFTALVQSSSTSNLVSTNIRMRWEYQPGSELFFVYTDERDSATPGFPDSRNRGVIVKVNRLFRM